MWQATSSNKPQTISNLCHNTIGIKNNKAHCIHFILTFVQFEIFLALFIKLGNHYYSAQHQRIKCKLFFFECVLRQQSHSFSSGILYFIVVFFLFILKKKPPPTIKDRPKSTYRTWQSVMGNKRDNSIYILYILYISKKSFSPRTWHNLVSFILSLKA